MLISYCRQVTGSQLTQGLVQPTLQINYQWFLVTSILLFLLTFHSFLSPMLNVLYLQQNGEQMHTILLCIFGPDIHTNQTHLLDSYPAIWRPLLFSPHRLLFPPPTFQNQDKKTLLSSPYFPTPPHIFILLLDLTETRFDQMCFWK